MNETIEQMIKRQPLRQPTRGLDERVQALLAEAAASPDAGRVDRRSGSPWRLMLIPVGAGLAAAAAVAIAALVGTPAVDRAGPDKPLIAAANLAPVDEEATIEISEYWVSAEPEDLLLVSDGGVPLRAVLRQSVQQTQWIDPADGVSIELTVPVEEIVLMPSRVY